MTCTLFFQIFLNLERTFSAINVPQLVFGKTPTDQRFMSCNYITKTPLTAITEHSDDVEFYIGSNFASTLLYLHRMELEVTLLITVKGPGEAAFRHLRNTDECSIANLPLYAVFESVEVILNATSLGVQKDVAYMEYIVS